MTISVTAYTGTELVSTTEWSLTTDTAGPDVDTNIGVYQAVLDVSALAFGDEFIFRVYEKARAADTQRVVYSATLSDAQADPEFITPSFILGAGWDMTILKVAGTDRTITWSIRKVS